MGDKDWHAGAVFASAKDLFGFEILRVAIHFRLTENSGRAGLEVIAVNRSRGCKTGKGIESFRVRAFAAEAVN